MSLSRDLLTVLDALPPSIPSNHISQYKQTISSNTDVLDNVEKNVGDASVTNRAVLASQASKILFGDRAVTPQGSSYKDEQQVNWSTTCWLPAACFIIIQNAVELALALRIITRTQCKFAIRSGGHMVHPGFSSVDISGVLLDLGALSEITLSPKGDIVSVGPGATWDRVYEELERHELTVVGGRASGVGVGGLLVGGGMSHFSNHWGMACDNVKNFEVVLANSTIVQANAEENSDLFGALKGGGSNFGIVTRSDLYTYPDHRVWYTFKVYSASDKERVMKASMEVQKAMDEDDRIGFFLSINTGFFVAGMLYRGECTAAPSVFHAFDDITPMAVPVPETKGTQLSVTQAASIEGKFKRECGSATVRADVNFHIELHNILSDIATSTSFTLACTIQPIGECAVKKGQDLGGNSLGILPESQSWLAILVQWSEDKDDDLARSQIRQLISSIETTAQSKGLLMDFHFLNDASFLQSPLKGCGTENLASLWATSHRWDPEGVFQRLQNSGFLLSKVETQHP